MHDPWVPVLSGSEYNLSYPAKKVNQFCMRFAFFLCIVCEMMRILTEKEEGMELKKSEEVLAEVHRNCQLALQSISDILPETEDAELKEELLRQHEDYEKIGGRAAILAKDKNIELKNPGPIKKAMMWGSIKMSTMTDNSRAHIAEMMVQGTVMGITALKSTLGEVCDDCADTEIISLAKELLAAEESFEKKWKQLIA